MVNTVESSQQTAPGNLEMVRELLNTWLIPNDTRYPTDRFDEYLVGRDVNEDDEATLHGLRDDLRSVVESDHAATKCVDRWIEQLRVRPVLTDGSLGFVHDGGPAGDILAAVIEAARDGRLTRLKACPDCRWVFYDHTRNRSKRWCLMNAGGPDGRACGTIAKVKRYRERHAASS